MFRVLFTAGLVRASTGKSRRCFLSGQRSRGFLSEVHLVGSGAKEHAWGDAPRFLAEDSRGTDGREVALMPRSAFRGRGLSLSPETARLPSAGRGRLPRGPELTSLLNLEHSAGTRHDASPAPPRPPPPQLSALDAAHGAPGSGRQEDERLFPAVSADSCPLRH